MEQSNEDPNPKPTRPDEPELDLYTIPSYSSWFAWGDIHETEKTALKEFFDGSSVTRTPKIYKEYRDFIINKYREDPTRRLTFTQVRKSLVGDVTFLHRVFSFLDQWGLINFSAPRDGAAEAEEPGKVNVRVEDGAPNGVRVVAMPNSMKPVAAAVTQNQETVPGSVSKLPPLASFADVFGEVAGKKEKKGFVCGSCGGSYDSGRYESTKDNNYVICEKCFEDGKYGENKSKEDFKLNNPGGDGSGESVWTEAETLLLLESVMRHGDDWELIAKKVPNRSKYDCISKLLELPFGDLVLSSVNGKNGNGNGNGKDQKETSVKDSGGDGSNVDVRNGEEAENEIPPSKRQRVASLSDAGGGSLMDQVALISTMVGADITTAAAEAAIAALCDETSCPREIFDGAEEILTNGTGSPASHTEPERASEVEDSEMKTSPSQSETQEASSLQNDIPLSLRLRAAIATALGSAAAHAKLLADQEDREVEGLLATVIEAQLKKVQCKIKHFDDLESIMEKEYAELDELKESLIEERIEVLQRVLGAGISKWRAHISARSHSGAVF
ncbi:hypothetical protein Tsubulata_000590 [Turnera subulata]|uniref:SWIRM domain-containing protein n=1 Tax=Turnera subulata TaxID=218843 RepID=A0A9Q0GKB8_9ROSI|nr:hypothetical protein Tsubulata_000590 [Turnera subulata]